jgi:uncharacterized protein
VKAEPSDQLKLLEVQVLDARADQARHRRAAMAEVKEMEALEASRSEVDDQRRDAQIVVDDLDLVQRKADNDVEQVKTRRTRDRDRIDQGLITNPKDLERMQHELESLDRRISVLEDEELEVMEQLEEAQSALGELVQRLAATDERLAELAVVRAEKTADIDRELGEIETERAAAVEGLPGDLLALYEKLRAAKGGVGAAEIRQRRCTGCQLGIDNLEIGVIRAAPADLIVRCEECERILVRTAESGL